MGAGEEIEDAVVADVDVTLLDGIVGVGDGTFLKAFIAEVAQDCFTGVPLTDREGLSKGKVSLATRGSVRPFSMKSATKSRGEGPPPGGPSAGMRASS